MISEDYKKITYIPKIQSHSETGFTQFSYKYSIYCLWSTVQNIIANMTDEFVW